MPPDVQKWLEEYKAQQRYLAELLRQFREEAAKGSCIPVTLRAEGE